MHRKSKGFSRESSLLLVTFGLLSVTFGLLSVTFGSLLINFGLLLINFGLLSVTFGSLLTNFGLHSTESGFISVESGPWTARRRHSRMMYGGVYRKGKAFPLGNAAWAAETKPYSAGPFRQRCRWKRGPRRCHVFGSILFHHFHELAQQREEIDHCIARPGRGNRHRN